MSYDGGAWYCDDPECCGEYEEATQDEPSLPLSLSEAHEVILDLRSRVGDLEARNTSLRDQRDTAQTRESEACKERNSAKYSMEAWKQEAEISKAGLKQYVDLSQKLQNSLVVAREENIRTFNDLEDLKAKYLRLEHSYLRLNVLYEEAKSRSLWPDEDWENLGGCIDEQGDDGDHTA